MDPNLAEHTESSAKELDVVLQLMGSMQFPEAVRWLYSPHRELDGRTPAEVLQTKEAWRVSDLIATGPTA